jgi:hypothetical protein
VLTSLTQKRQSTLIQFFSMATNSGVCEVGGRSRLLGGYSRIGFGLANEQGQNTASKQPFANSGSVKPPTGPIKDPKQDNSLASVLIWIKARPYVPIIASAVVVILFLLAAISRRSQGFMIYC